ncbi:MAG: acyl-CoA dehydrogenase family protein [Pseudomonadales bacterium]|nr:acyl-CoA dehydrogenase family protein [Pseudomonadales bacterium]MBO6565607.1 acyl-CoA dehydrogenase family protein [Pseudomonadales bacterium]MBO6595338.1 acyl-CoA dehydrogenase family protein [Pseudomonadales bacterium]MBO6655774.1 acyl-CoA dehydrogenase family protein [Pseudomonadales bacterium]MBO6701839.1 acyl-CoA dehydrogenase family protein [Pseudomonadales bacterium]
MDLDIPERLIPVRDKIDQFVRSKVDPLTQEYYDEIDVGDRWELTGRQLEILDGLKDQAREAGLWNFFLPESQGGAGVSNLEYAHLAEVMARNPIASEIFNCAAPDTGNMEVLERYGSEDQKKQWLEPLLEGKIRSAFAMTEPHVASSDATNISTSAVLEGDEWVINGEKHYISGAGDPRCKIMITMVVTNPDAPKHLRQSQILVPLPHPGVEVLRPMYVFGKDDAPHGHMHIKFDNVRVPKENIILGEGRGFEISQGRLGPGRIHHCMRSIGVAERALELLCKRALSRTAFGKPLAELGGNYDVIADSRIELDMCRLAVLRAAHMMDTIGNKEARKYISAIKVAVPNMALKVIDRAIQIHGALGVSQDTPLPAMWTSQRTLRLADGPDEVHRRVIAREELKKYQ